MRRRWQDGIDSEAMKEAWNCVASVDQTAATLKGALVAAESIKSREQEDEVREALVSRKPAMFVSPSEECHPRIGESYTGLGNAMKTEMEPEWNVSEYFPG